MIQQTTIAMCDSCEHALTFLGIITDSAVEERLLHTGWTIQDNLHYCADCSEDELTPHRRRV